MFELWRGSIRTVQAALVAGAMACATPARADAPAVTGDADPAHPAARDTSEPKGTLLLSDVLALALRQSPELEPFAWQGRADEARVVQAGIRANPRADGVLEDVLGSGRFRDARQAQLTLQLSQLIELGGKRTARVRTAEASRDLGRADYEVKRVEVLSDATERFIEVLERQAVRELANKNAKLAESGATNVQRRMHAGAGTPLEEKKAQIALARARVDAEDAVHELAVARTALAASWGSTAPRFERAAGDLAKRGRIPAFVELADRIETSPDVLRLLSEQKLRKAELALMQSRRVPDVTVSAGPRWLEGPRDHAFVFGLAVPLPVFDRNQNAVAEAEAFIGKSGAATRAARVRLRATLFALHESLVHASHEISALETAVIPATEQALSIAEDGFVGGRFSYLDLLDAQRTFVDVRRQHVATGASYHRLVLAIERLTGMPLAADAGAHPAPSHEWEAR